MIDVYAWTTPNGRKALIAAEELGVAYRVRWVDITKGEQKLPDYLAINPNGKIPAIVDPDGPDGNPISVFESGAIAIYLAEKTGKLLPTTGAARYVTLEWVFFNIGGPGPMLGQLGYYTKFSPEKHQPSIERFSKEADRLLGVLDGRLAQVRYLAGSELTIADIINFTWPHGAKTFLGLDLGPYPNLVRWMTELEQRPAFAKALALEPGS